MHGGLELSFSQERRKSVKKETKERERGERERERDRWSEVIVVF